MLSFSKVGLASSVARPENYSWRSTIQYARELEIKQIQLFLNPTDLNSQHLKLLQKTATEFKLHLHLPPVHIKSDIRIFLNSFFRKLENEIFLIQHQCHAKDLLHASLNSDKILIAIENDLPHQPPQAFLDFVLKLINENERTLPVIDIPRFFHQAPAGQTFEQISKQVLNLIWQLQFNQIPFIIHAIDHSAKGTSRAFWKPLLEGDIPWPDLIKMFIERSDLLKCFMFEYENWDMVKKSVKNLVKENFLKLI